MIQTAVFDFDGTQFDSMFIRDNDGEPCLCSIGKDQPLILRAVIEHLWKFALAE